MEAQTPTPEEVPEEPKTEEADKKEGGKYTGGPIPKVSPPEQTKK